MVCCLTACGVTGSALRENQALCNEPSGWVSVGNPKYVIFGEVHGTEQSPRMAGQYVCVVAMTSGPVLFAIELPARLNGELQQAWESKEPLDAEFLSRVSDGPPLAQDGAFTDATLSVLAWLRSIRDLGADIDVVAISGPRDTSQAEEFAELSFLGQREAMYAANVRLAAAARRYAQVVVLVGNAHAQKQPLGSSEYKSMASLLAEESTVISLAMRHSGGTAWNCVAQEGVTSPSGQPSIVCGPRQLQVNSENVAFTLGIELMPLDGLGFDGYFNLGVVSSAAPPN